MLIDSSSFLEAGRGGAAERWLLSEMRTGQPSMVLLPAAWSQPDEHRQTAAPPPDTEQSVLIPHGVGLHLVAIQ